MTSAASCRNPQSVPRAGSGGDQLADAGDQFGATDPGCVRGPEAPGTADFGCPIIGRPVPGCLPVAQGDPHAAFGGHLEGAVVAGVGVADHARAGVVGQQPLQLPGGQFGTVGDPDLPAWRERPMPTPPPWWMDTQVAPEAA